MATKSEGMISKDMTIGEVVQKYPQAAHVMLNYGLHCVGCHVNIYETIEQGAQGHGMTEKEISSMLKDINKSLKSVKTTSKNPIVLTAQAALKIKELAQKQNKKGYGLRIMISEGGCAGFSYAMGLTNEEKEGDVVISQNKIKIYVSKYDLENLKGSSVDYLESFSKSGFVVNNPNAKQTCSCGQSFH